MNPRGVGQLETDSLCEYHWIGHIRVPGPMWERVARKFKVFFFSVFSFLRVGMSDDGRLRVDDRMRSVMDRRFSRPAGRTQYTLVGQVGGSGVRDRVPGSLKGSYIHGLIVLAIVVDAAIDRWCLNFKSSFISERRLRFCG